MQEISRSDWSEHYKGLTEEVIEKIPKLRNFDRKYVKDMIESF